MKKSTPLLDLYTESIIDGVLPCHGLCDSVPSDNIKLLKLFQPKREFKEADYWAFDGNHRSFWNEYGGLDAYHVMFTFTPLRQTIVLLLAAMNNEL